MADSLGNGATSLNGHYVHSPGRCPVCRAATEGTACACGWRRVLRTFVPEKEREDMEGVQVWNWVTRETGRWTRVPPGTVLVFDDRLEGGEGEGP